MDGRDAGQPFRLFAFWREEGKGEVEAFDFAEPAFVGGPASAGLEVFFDLVEAGQHLGIGDQWFVNFTFVTTGSSAKGTASLSLELITVRVAGSGSTSELGGV